MHYVSLLAILLSAEPSMTAVPMCSIDAGRVFFHVEIDTKWIDSKGEPQNMNEILQVNCDRKRRTCAGAVLRTKVRSSNGKLQIGMLDLVGIRGAELRSVKGPVAVIDWGVHQLVLDTTAGTVTKSADNTDGGERGVGNCETKE